MIHNDNEVLQGSWLWTWLPPSPSMNRRQENATNGNSKQNVETVELWFGWIPVMRHVSAFHTIPCHIEMNRIGIRSPNAAFVCPLCGQRRGVEAFLDPFTCTLLSNCMDCRRRLSQCWGVISVLWGCSCVFNTTETLCESSRFDISAWEQSERSESGSVSAVESSGSKREIEEGCVCCEAGVPSIDVLDCACWWLAS